MLGIEEQQKLMVTHNHKYLKEDTDFLAPPKLPDEVVDTMDITEVLTHLYNNWLYNCPAHLVI